MVNLPINLISVMLLTSLLFATSCHTTDSASKCDLNEESCFMGVVKEMVERRMQGDITGFLPTWNFTYHDTKQSYIDAVSKGQSWLTNPLRSYQGLARIDGGKEGDVQRCDFDDGTSVEVITRATKPLLFEIPNLLSDEECDHIIERAISPDEGGMFESVAKGGLTPVDTFQRSGKKGKASNYLGEFYAWDINRDSLVTKDESVVILHWQKALSFTVPQVVEMFEKLGFAAVFNDDVITRDEFQTLDTIAIDEECDWLYRNDPRFQQRSSNQTWLQMERTIDPTIHNIREKLVKISGLPREVIYGGELLQVVHYVPGGHYHAHMDSETHERPGIPCCHQFSGSMLESVDECRLCRYVTFLLYLNDVEEGGETAFPNAGAQTLLTENELRGNSTTDKYNLSHGCKRSNLLVKPKRGTAILWYNHHLNATDGWMGELDKYALHGGCDVRKGNKWIANMWITAPYGTSRHLPSQYLNWEDLYHAELFAKSKSY